MDFVHGYHRVVPKALLRMIIFGKLYLSRLQRFNDGFALARQTQCFAWLEDVIFRLAFQRYPEDAGVNRDVSDVCFSGDGMKFALRQMDTLAGLIDGVARLTIVGDKPIAGTQEFHHSPAELVEPFDATDFHTPIV